MTALAKKLPIYIVQQAIAISLHTTCLNCKMDGFMVKVSLIKKVNIYQYTYHTSVFQLLVSSFQSNRVYELLEQVI